MAEDPASPPDNNFMGFTSEDEAAGLTDTLDQPESMEMDSAKDNDTDPEKRQEEEEQVEMAESTSPKPQENEGEEDEAPQPDTQDTSTMECDEPEGGGSEEQKETSEKEQAPGDTDGGEPSELASDIAVVMMEDEVSQSEILDVDQSVSDQRRQETDDGQSQDNGTEEVTNPLATSADPEATDKPASEPDVLEIISVDMPTTDKSTNAKIHTASTDKDKNTSPEKQSDASVTLSLVEGPEKASEGSDDSSCSGEAPEAQSEGEDDGVDDGEDIVELPVQKEPAMLVDLADEEENTGNPRKKSQKQHLEDRAASRDGKRIKLRSLASLVDVNSGEEDAPGHPHPDIPGIGEIVEHGVIIGSDEMDGLQLRISNVVGGEDCITGLTVDEDRDAFSSIQISSVTTLIEPISPEDPNQIADDGEKSSPAEGSEKESAGSQPSVAKSSDTSTPQTVSGDGTGAAAAAKDGDKTTSDEAKKSSEKDSEKDSTSNPKIRLSSAVSEVAKDAESGEGGSSSSSSSPARCVYHILRSILTVKRDCTSCAKKLKCEFRIVKKDESGTWGFLCSGTCRSKWTTALAPDHVVERPRLIFEKLCGMCGKDLANLPRDGQYSWETREFCSKDCLTDHLHEVAGNCHLCNDKVRHMFIGKYCVRFGSDIHQFCSNTCLECYKTKIKVCCYCQKNLIQVNKVTSVSNKEYCSTKCLKRAQRRDIGQQNHSDQLPCTVCQTTNLNRYEFVSHQECYQLCSDPCLNVYKYANKVKAVPCCLCFRVMNAEDVAHYLYHGGHQLRVFCSDSCVNVFILSARKIVVCEVCKVKKYNFDMVHRQVDEDFRDYFYCSLSCLNSKQQNQGKKSKNGINSVSAKNGSVTSSSSSDPPVTSCNMCNATAKAQYHMVMSDNTLRSFCRYACASKYKNTFGFQVNGIQSSDSSETAPSTPVIREKPTQKAPTSQPEDTETTSLTKKKSVCDPIEDVNSVTAELLRLLMPPTMVNKTTSCRPGTLTKGVYCKPHPWHRQTQTDSSDMGTNTTNTTTTNTTSTTTTKAPAILPVPVPIYVPTPMMTYSLPYPVPVVVPVPLPVPIFIPTTAKTTGDIAKMMNKIQEEMPADPYEAEMLLLARASSESVEAETLMQETQENPSGASDCGSHGGIDDLKDIDVSCLDSVEDDIPRYSLKPIVDLDLLSADPVPDSDEDADDPEEVNPNKRKLDFGDEEHSRKRLCPESHESVSASEAEREPQSSSPSFATEPIGEEFPSPDLNKMYGLAAWKKWVTTKNAELAKVSSSRSMKMISDDLLAMNCEELNYALCLFLKDLRKSNGEMYQPDTVFYLLLGIQQHLFDSARTDCIFMDFGFEKFTNSFDEITKTFVNQSVVQDESCDTEAGVTRITETMLWECRQLGAHTPQVLLNTLFYFNTKIFKLKTLEEHQALSFPQIVKQWRRTVVVGSVMRTSLLKYFAPKTDGDKRRVQEMHENRDDPLRCPVKLYEFYLSKCPESLRTQQGIYYVHPERSCVPDSPTWFSNQPVQAASLSKMLHRTLMVKEVQEALAE